MSKESVKVRVIKQFGDKKKSYGIREKGSVFMTTQARADELVEAGVAEIIAPETKEKKEIEGKREKKEINKPGE